MEIFLKLINDGVYGKITEERNKPYKNEFLGYRKKAKKLFKNLDFITDSLKNNAKEF